MSIANKHCQKLKGETRTSLIRLKDLPRCIKELFPLSPVYPFLFLLSAFWNDFKYKLELRKLFMYMD